MRQTIRIFLLVEAVSFGTASFIHAGVLIGGYEHHGARIAEGVLAIVLLVAVASTWIRPTWTRQAGLAGQGIALLGTLIGVFVGPRTVPDIIYHVAIIAVLIWGLVIAWRAPADEARRNTP